MELLNRLQLLWARLGVALVLFGMPLDVFAAVEKETGLDMPRDVSLDGHRITWLINITMWFLLILFVLMVAWMAVAMFKHDESHPAQYDHGDAGKQIAVAMTISGVIFLVVDGNLYINAMKDLDEVFWNFKEIDSNPDTVRIEINAHQWAWDMRYAGPDGQWNTADDVVTLNDMRIPVDRPILIQLTSSDVIHAFNVPNARVKTDAVPGTVNPLWFQISEVGEYDIACAEHCGSFHYKMKGLMTVLSQEDYEAWLEESSHQSALAYNPDDADSHWGWPWKEL
jgi:cytochrome c oxidase subunit 2